MLQLKFKEATVEFFVLDRHIFETRCLITTMGNENVIICITYTCMCKVTLSKLSMILKQLHQRDILTHFIRNHSIFFFNINDITTLKKLNKLILCEYCRTTDLKTLYLMLTTKKKRTSQSFDKKKTSNKRIQISLTI